MTLNPPTSRQVPSPDYGLMNGLGLLSWNYNANTMNSAGPLTTQVVYAMVVPTNAAAVYTGVKLITTTPATSTAPTGFFVGLATLANIGSTGAMIAQSANLAASASLTTGGAQNYPFNATYTETATGVRVVLILQNGAFGGTNWQTGRMSGNQYGVNGQTFTYGTAGTAVTAFQANGQNLANAYATTSSPFPWWVGLY